MEQALLQPATLVAERAQLVQHWQQRAELLKPQALAELQAIQDEPMRLLYLKNQPLVPGQERALGSFVHVPLMRQLAQACKALDSKYIDEMAKGFLLWAPSPVREDGTLVRPFQICLWQSSTTGPGKSAER